MSENRYPHLFQEITKAIENPGSRDSLYRCMKRGRDTRAEALRDLPGGEAFRDDVRRVKEDALDRQQELLDQFVANAEGRGAKVFMAKDGAEATEYVLKLAGERNAATIAKSKSLTTEEIEINVPLEEAGHRVVETDLGELIIQLVGEKPYHLVFPAVHKTTAEVAKIFQDATGKEVNSDIPSIMPVVRDYLRPIFLNADIGMTGANVGIAETGGIVIETNEGNGRLVTSIGDCHVCVMGVEKIVETVEDAMLMVLAHPISATGQCPTTYVTWMHGRSPLGEGGKDARESHIIILDNGRSAARQDDAMKEALYCIRCGACMNICPTYGVVGGHTFGHIYPGPIGIPWTAMVHSLDIAGDFAPLCLSCGLCKEICPAKIDIPMLIAEVKQRDMKMNPPPTVNKTMMATDMFSALGSATAPLSNVFLRNPLARTALEKMAGVDRRRELPAFKRPSFHKRFKRRKAPAQEGTGPKVVLFADLYGEYNDPDLAMTVVECLEQGGCEVAVPEQKSSGYPYIAYGDLDRARDRARYNLARLAPLAREGYTIISPEPTAAYTLKMSYPYLLDNNDDSRVVSEQTSELFEFLLTLDSAADQKALEGQRFGFHCACHQWPLGSGKAAMEWLARRGAEVQLVTTGTCCGMGGTFGLKAGPLGYDLSQAVGQKLFDAFRESGVEVIVTESSVCAIQLREGTGLPVLHPLELLSQS